VHVDATRHHDHARRVDRAIGSQGGVSRRLNDATFRDPDVANLAPDSIAGIVDFASSDAEQDGSLSRGFPLVSSRCRDFLKRYANPQFEAVEPRL
jgi:hypothetical protein